MIALQQRRLMSEHSVSDQGGQSMSVDTVSTVCVQLVSCLLSLCAVFTACVLDLC
jgi:hypothetical protein